MKPSDKKINKELIESLNNLHSYLHEEWLIWAIKPYTKTILYLTEWKVAITTMRGFVEEDNWKATYVTYST